MIQKDPNYIISKLYIGIVVRNIIRSNLREATTIHVCCYTNCKPTVRLTSVSKRLTPVNLQCIIFIVNMKGKKLK